MHSLEFANAVRLRVHQVRECTHLVLERGELGHQLVATGHTGGRSRGSVLLLPPRP